MNQQYHQKVSQIELDDHQDQHPQTQIDLHDDIRHDPHLNIIQQQQQSDSVNYQGYLTLIGGVTIHFVLGTFYLWGGISPYVAAYLKQYDPSVTLTTMSLVFPILGMCATSVLSFGVKLGEKFGVSTVIFGGGFSISLAFLIVSFIHSFWAFLFIYCIMIGIASGLVYMLPIICCWRYFPANKGRISGLIVAGYGFGSFIFNFICLAIVNPTNIKPNLIYIENGHNVKYFGPDVYNNVPTMLRILSGSYFALTIIGTLLIKYPKDIVIKQQQQKQSQQQQADEKKHTLTSIDTQECQSLKQGLKSRPFTFLMPMIMLSTIFGLLMANVYKIYGLQMGMGDDQLTIIGSVGSVCNGCSRIFWANLMDKHGFKLIFIIIMVINLVCASTISYTNANFIGYLLLYGIIMACEGAMLSCFPAEAGKIFGSKFGPIIYGGLYFGVGLSNFFAYLLMKYTVPFIQFVGLFWIMFSLQVIALVFGIFFRDSHNWTR